MIMRPVIDGTTRLGALALVVVSATLGCTNRRASANMNDAWFVERHVADAVHAVLAADRAIYAREVVDRLQNKEQVLSASEHFRDEKRLPLPAQMLRMGAEEMRKSRRDLSYGLVSLWPLNRQNGPRTAVERAGLEALDRGSAAPYTSEETLGKESYFTAIYPDRAVSDACITCHNAHEASPRKDFRAGDIMGGIVIRVARRL